MASPARHVPARRSAPDSLRPPPGSTPPEARSARSPRTARSGPASSRSTSSATTSISRSGRGQLDRDYLLVTQISQGIGELGLDGGSLDPLRPGPLPPRGRPGRAVGGELPLGRARPARRWRGRWPTRSGTRSPSRSRSPPSGTRTDEILVDLSPFLALRLGRRGRACFQTSRSRSGSCSGDVIARRQALQPPGAAALPRQPRGGGRGSPSRRPRNLGLETVSGLPLDSDRRSLLAAASCPPRRCGRASRTTGWATSSRPSRTSPATPRRASSSAT